MKLFQSIQNSFAHMGINSDQSIQSHSFNIKNVISILLHITSVISTILYLLKVADSFGDYTNAAFSISGVTVSGLGAVNVIWTMKKWFNVMNDFEKIINKRKSKIKKLKRFHQNYLCNLQNILFSGLINPECDIRTYEKCNRKIEKLCQTIKFYGLKVWPPCIILPKFVFSFYLYFVKNAENDAFELPLYMW